MRKGDIPLKIIVLKLFCNPYILMVNLRIESKKKLKFDDSSTIQNLGTLFPKNIYKSALQENGFWSFI